MPDGAELDATTLLGTTLLDERRLLEDGARLLELRRLELMTELELGTLELDGTTARLLELATELLRGTELLDNTGALDGTGLLDGATLEGAVLDDGTTAELTELLVSSLGPIQAERLVARVAANNHLDAKVTGFIDWTPPKRFCEKNEGRLIMINPHFYRRWAIPRSA